MKMIAMVLVVAACVGTVDAAVQAKVVEYKQGDAVLEGFLAWDDAVQGKRPGVLIVHDWTGVGDYVQVRARKLAEMGYVAFAADIYGKGVRPKTPQESAAQAGIYKQDRKLMRARAWPTSKSYAAIRCATPIGSLPSATASAAPVSWSLPAAEPTLPAW